MHNSRIRASTLSTRSSSILATRKPTCQAPLLPICLELPHPLRPHRERSQSPQPAAHRFVHSIVVWVHSHPSELIQKAQPVDPVAQARAAAKAADFEMQRQKLLSVSTLTWLSFRS